MGTDTCILYRADRSALRLSLGTVLRARITAITRSVARQNSSTRCTRLQLDWLKT